MTQKDRSFERNFTRIEKSGFSLSLGVRVAIFVVAPIALGVFIHESYLLFSTLGAFLLAMTEGQPSTPFASALALACFTEATAVGIGTLVATTGPVTAPILLGIALFIILLARGTAKFNTLGTFTAIAFAFGVGIPGASLESAGIRASFVLIGSLWGLFGFGLHRFIVKRRKGRRRPSSAIIAPPPPIAHSLSRSERLRSALLVAIACAIGFSIGYAFGFPRDYWVVATIIFTVRPSISLTATFTALLAAGTAAGALIAAVITIAIGSNDVYLLTLVLFVLGILLFSSRGVNFGLMQLFLTSFIIVLLNIAFPGEWYLAIYRILDVGIGIGISFVLVESLRILKKEKTWL